MCDFLLTTIFSVEATAATKADDIVARMMWNQTKEEMYVLYINTDFHKTVLTEESQK